MPPLKLDNKLLGQIALVAVFVAVVVSAQGFGGIGSMFQGLLGQSAQVSCATPLTVSSNLPTTAYQGDTFTFQASSNVPGASFSQRFWKPGEAAGFVSDPSWPRVGQTGSETRVLDQVGDYRVAVTARDSACNRTASTGVKTLTVLPKPQGPVGGPLPTPGACIVNVSGNKTFAEFQSTLNAANAAGNRNSDGMIKVCLAPNTQITNAADSTFGAIKIPGDDFEIYTEPNSGAVVANSTLTPLGLNSSFYVNQAILVDGVRNFAVSNLKLKSKRIGLDVFNSQAKYIRNLQVEIGGGDSYSLGGITITGSDVTEITGGNIKITNSGQAGIYAGPGMGRDPNLPTFQRWFRGTNIGKIESVSFDNTAVSDGIAGGVTAAHSSIWIDAQNLYNERGTNVEQIVGNIIRAGKTGISIYQDAHIGNISGNEIHLNDGSLFFGGGIDVFNSTVATIRNNIIDGTSFGADNNSMPTGIRISPRNRSTLIENNNIRIERGQGIVLSNNGYNGSAEVAGINNNSISIYSTNPLCLPYGTACWPPYANTGIMLNPALWGEMTKVHSMRNNRIETTDRAAPAILIHPYVSNHPQISCYQGNQLVYAPNNQHPGGIYNGSSITYLPCS